MNTEDLERDLHEREVARHTAPAWHARPTSPGWWLCIAGEPGKPYLDAIPGFRRFTAEEITAGVPFHCAWAFGPIPEPPEPTQ